MSAHTGRRHSPQGQYNTAGRTLGHDNADTRAQHGVVLNRRADGVERPFPNKPVSHRRPLKTQKSIDTCDSEKITTTKQPRGHMLLHEHPSNGIRETTTSQDPRKDSHRLPRGELQMAKAIHAKELLLQEKLWRVEEKVRQKLQKDGDQKSEEERHCRGQAEGGKAQTKTRLSEQQRREPVRGRDRIPQGGRQVDVQQLGKRQDQRNEDRTRSTHEEERSMWKGREMEVAQQQRKGHKVPHRLAGNEQKISKELNKSRWENVKEHTRRKEGEDNGTWGKAHGDKCWTTEKKYKERTSEGTGGSNSQQDMLQMSQEKSSRRAATDNNSGAGRTLPGEPLLPPLCSPSHPSRPEPEELITEHIDTSLQLTPCRICNRKFSSDRLQKHSQICKKVKQSNRQAYNSYVHRTKGSANEEFLKTHSRARTPEVLKKKNPRQNQKANTRNLHVGHPAEPKVSK